MYVSIFELTQATQAFLQSDTAIYSPSLYATAKRFLDRLTKLNRNSLSVSEIYNLFFESTVLPWHKTQTTQQPMTFILGGVNYA